MFSPGDEVTFLCVHYDMDVTVGPRAIDQKTDMDQPLNEIRREQVFLRAEKCWKKALIPVVRNF